MAATCADPVAPALTADHLASRQVTVLHAQVPTLQQAQAGTVHAACQASTPACKRAKAR